MRGRLPAAGGRAYGPSSFGIGADPGHHEHRRPNTNVPTEAGGRRSRAARELAAALVGLQNRRRRADAGR
jgi:hypothetical protein